MGYDYFFCCEKCLARESGVSCKSWGWEMSAPEKITAFLKKHITACGSENIKIKGENNVDNYIPEWT